MENQAQSFINRTALTFKLDTCIDQRIRSIVQSSLNLNAMDTKTSLLPLPQNYILTAFKQH